LLSFRFRFAFVRLCLLSCPCFFGAPPPPPRAPCYRRSRRVSQFAAFAFVSLSFCFRFAFVLLSLGCVCFRVPVFLAHLHRHLGLHAIAAVGESHSAGGAHVDGELEGHVGGLEVGEGGEGDASAQPHLPPPVLERLRLADGPPDVET
jgi:hypothetical protein